MLCQRETILTRTGRRIPLALKVAAFVSLISIIGAVVLGVVDVAATRDRVNDQYATEASGLTRIITDEVMRDPGDYEKTNDQLISLVQTHPTLLRVRLFRGPPFGPPLVWASSYHTDFAVDAGQDVLVSSRERLQKPTTLDGQPAFLDVEPVDYPNGVVSIAFYFEGAPRLNTISETGRRVVADSAYVIAVQLLALIVAMYLLVLRRVNRLGRAAAAVGRGDLSVGLPESRTTVAGDELTTTAREFDHMVRAVASRARQQEAVAELGRLALVGELPTKLLAEAAVLVSDAMLVDRVQIHQATGPATLTLVAATGFAGDVLGTTAPAGTASQPGFTLVSEGPVLVADTSSETRFEQSALLKNEGVASGVSVIIASETGAFGVLSAFSLTQRLFTKDDVSFTQSMANVLAEAIGRQAALARERQSEARYRLVVEHATELIILVTPDRKVAYTSPSVLAVMGYEPSSLLGVDTAHLVDPASRGVVEDAQRAALDGRIVPISDLKSRKADGTFAYLDGTVAPILDEDGSVSLALLIFHDVTESREAREERRRLLARLLAAHEEERLRIAADIHDDPIQTMTAAALRLEGVRRLSKDPKQIEMLDKLEDSVSGAITRLRKLMFELRPPALDREGLAAALRDYLASSSRESGFSFNLQSSLKAEPNLESRAISFRIAKEALVNAAKHAHAKRIDISLDHLDGGVRVRVEDDGIGFDVTEAEQLRDHVGLTSMRERAGLAGGWCRITSSPGGGTSVEFFVPDQDETTSGVPDD